MQETNVQVGLQEKKIWVTKIYNTRFAKDHKHTTTYNQTMKLRCGKIIGNLNDSRVSIFTPNPFPRNHKHTTILRIKSSGNSNGDGEKGRDARARGDDQEAYDALYDSDNSGRSRRGR